MTRRRQVIAAALAAPWVHTGARATDRAADGRKVLRIAFNSAETGFDPAQVSDLYSRTVLPHIFEALYAYDHLARPFRYVPLTAAGMPEVSDDFRVWTIRLKPGIYFADDPAFKGARRELVAQDYVYAFQRVMDPANKSPAAPNVTDIGFVGLAEIRAAAREGRRFDYDRPVPGLRALDRHTLRIELDKPRPRLLQTLAMSDWFGGVAREVIEFYGADTMAHPVGTGPFRLAQWRRSSLIVLEKNPSYRERLYDAQPAPDDPEGQAILARMKGRRLPMIDRVEISIIQEEQPRWLAFLQGQLDIAGVPGAAIVQAVPNGRLAPNLARRGIQHHRVLNADSVYTYFNMLDPVVGGMEPHKVALRRALSLSLDVDRLIRLLYRGQAIPAQSLFIPHCSGFDPTFKSEMGDHDPARARALLDLYGFKDVDGDGWREQPDGSPLTIEVATQPNQFNRQFDELWKKDFAAIGIRTTFFTGQWAEQLKAARAAKLMMWTLGGSAASPDGQDSLAAYDSRQFDGQNFARFVYPEIDRLTDRTLALPDGPEREALFHRAKLIGTAYMPYKSLLHRMANTLVHPQVKGYRRPLFWNEYYHLIDIEGPEA